MPKLTWFWEAVFAMMLLIPAWLGLSGFSRAWNVRGEVALLWYMVGVIIGVGVFTLKTTSVIPEQSNAVWWLLGLGLFVGSVANILSFRAVAQAPNPGLPVAITGSVIVGGNKENPSHRIDNSVKAWLEAAGMEPGSYASEILEKDIREVRVIREEIGKRLKELLKRAESSRV